MAFMANNRKEIMAKAWAHCTGPVTVRSIVFVAVTILFIWALFDRLAVRDNNRAMQQRLELYSVETQRGLSQIYQSWAKFDASQTQVLANQRAMQDEINTQTKILTAEHSLRERELNAQEKLHQMARGQIARAEKRANKPRRRAVAKRSSRSKVLSIS
jgi:hypothetical protein